MQTSRQKLRRLYFYASTIPNLFRLREMAFLRRHLEIKRRDRILDVACGIGVYSDILAGKASIVVGFDLARGSVAIANHIRKDNAFFYIGDAEAICHPSESFDIVVSICAIEHFNDSGKPIREMFRVLKPGGQLLVTVDSLENIASKDFIEFHRKMCFVQKYFTVDSLRRELEEAGFEIGTVEPLLTSPLSAVLCRLAFEVLKWHLLFGVYSLLAYPLSLIFDALSSGCRSGITVAAHARKPLARSA